MEFNNITTAAIAIELESVDISQFIKFKEKFNKWIHSSTQLVKGLPKSYYIVSGVTDAFNQMYGMHNKIGIFEGEYGYHSLVIKNRVTFNLDEADAIVVSHPFSADGMSSHEKIKIADSHNKPIFIDCAFFGVCHDIDFDFARYKNIHSVCFSLSKSFGTGLHRVGLLYTIDPYPVTVYSQWHYPLVACAEHHYTLLDTMSPDSMIQKYKDSQLEICQEFNITPSNTIIFGLDYSTKYVNFKRGPVNRLCISHLLKL
jgi:hypothetical protein